MNSNCENEIWQFYSEKWVKELDDKFMKDLAIIENTRQPLNDMEDVAYYAQKYVESINNYSKIMKIILNKTKAIKEKKMKNLKKWQFFKKLNMRYKQLDDIREFRLRTDSLNRRIEELTENQKEMRKTIKQLTCPHDEIEFMNHGYRKRCKKCKKCDKILKIYPMIGGEFYEAQAQYYQEKADKMNKTAGNPKAKSGKSA